MSLTTSVEVAVVGAGPVGLALACLLGRSGVDCALVRDGPATESTPAQERDDPRVLALTLATRIIFSECGAWARLAEADRTGFSRMLAIWSPTKAGRSCMST